MDDEFVPKKLEKKVEEVNVEPQEKPLENELKVEDTSKKKRSIGKVISRIIWALVFLFVVFETVLGVLNMQKIKEDKKPIWCMSEKEEKTNNKTETTCNLGLYVIVKTVEGKNKTISLKPFFLK